MTSSENEMCLKTQLSEILERAPVIWQMATRLEQVAPEMWLAAGAIVQTVWNLRTGRNLGYGILDYDLVYFGVGETASEEWTRHQALAAEWPQYPLDVKNQARVHLWYPDKFGLEIPPLQSLSAALCTWPSTATATAVRRVQGQWEILAPFGLSDLLNLVVRPNATLVSAEIYARKTARWRSLWPELEILPFEAALGPFEINRTVDLDPVQS